MKSIFKTTLAGAVIATVSMGSYKAYDSYVASYMSEEELLLAENVEALSFDSDAGSSKKKKILVPNKSGSCWDCKITKREPIYSNGRYVGDRTYQTSSCTGSTWQTCKRETVDDENAQDRCTKQNCPDGQYTQKQYEGWFPY